MRGRLIKETENFTRGGDPYAKLGIGKFGIVPKPGTMQDGSFDLLEISGVISSYYDLPVKNYTDIDDGSNYNWDEAYQKQFITLNIDLTDLVVKRILGPEYYKKSRLITEKHPNISLAIGASQKKWISKHLGRFEYEEVFLVVGISGSRYSIPIDVKGIPKLEDIIIDILKDKIILLSVWNLHYSKNKILRKDADIFDVRDFIEEYGEQELVDLLQQSYTWKNTLWKIIDGFIYDYKKDS